MQQADLVLFIGGGQYLAAYKDHQGAAHLKFVSPQVLATAFSLQALDSGWLPPGTIRTGFGAEGPYYLTLHPAGIYHLRVHDGHTIPDLPDIPAAPGARDGQIRHLAAPLPQLLLLGYGRTYWCWAAPHLGGKHTAMQDIQLYYPPLPNIYSSSTAICWGANHPPVVSPEGMVAAWDLFLASYFTAAEQTNRSRTYPNDCRGMLRHLAEHGATVYPVKDLVPIPHPYGTLHAALASALHVKP